MRIYHLTRPKGLFRHHAIAVEAFAGEALEVYCLGPAGLERQSLETFADGREVRTDATLDHPSDVEVACQRLRELCHDSGRYNAFANNCEHAAQYVIAGTRRSLQARTICTAVAAGSLAVIILLRRSA